MAPGARRTCTGTCLRGISVRAVVRFPLRARTLSRACMLNARRHLARVLSLDSPSLVRRCIHTSAPFLMPIVVISPAKALDETPLSPSVPRTEPRLTTNTAELIKTCKRLTAPKIKSLMGVSDAIASLNAERFARWMRPRAEAVRLRVRRPRVPRVRRRVPLRGRARARPDPRPFPQRALRSPPPVRRRQALPSRDGLQAGDGSRIQPLRVLGRRRHRRHPRPSSLSPNLSVSWSTAPVRSTGSASTSISSPSAAWTCTRASSRGPSVYAKAARGAMCRHVAETRATDPDALEPSWASTANGVSRRPSRRTVKPWSSKDRTPVRNRRRFPRRAEPKEAKEGGDGIRNRNRREPRSAPARRRRRRTRTDPRRARDAPRRRRRDRSHVKACRFTFRHASVRISSRHLFESGTTRRCPSSRRRRTRPRRRRRRASRLRWRPARIVFSAPLPSLSRDVHHVHVSRARPGER